MAHVPHLAVPGPWERDHIALDDQTVRHLHKVLRRTSGAPVSYTDGRGTLGEGSLGEASIVRGDETVVDPASPRLTIAVAPPKSNDRTRFLVEKLAELDVTQILWLHTRHTEGRPPSDKKARAWAAMALEQSRGAWLTEVSRRVDVVDLPTSTWYADRDGEPLSNLRIPEGPTTEVVIAIGPEGGFAEEEIPDEARRVCVGRRTLRIETAAIAAAALVRV